MENLIVSIRCVTPMFVMLCLGSLIRHSEIVSPKTFEEISTLSFRTLLPCMLFHNIYSSDLNSAFQGSLLLFLLGWLAVWFFLSFVLFTRFVPDPRQRGAYIQDAFRSNIAVIGLSLAEVLMDETGAASAAVAIAVIVPLFNVLAVITLEVCRDGKTNIWGTFKAVWRNPLIIASLLGVLFVLLGLRLPSALELAIQKIGDAGSVMTLVALGASLRFDGLRRNIQPVVFGSILRLVITPLCALTAAVLLGFRGDALGVVLLCTGTPTGSSAYPMAMVYGSDHELTGQFVVTTSLFCCLTLFLWIFLLKQIGLM